MATPQTREPAGAPEATAGSRLHPDTAGLIVVMLAWFIVAVAAALVAAAAASKGTDPTIYLGIIGAGWMFLTPWAMPALKQRTGRKGRR